MKPLETTGGEDIIFHCSVEIERGNRHERTTIFIKKEVWSSGLRYIVTAIRNDKQTSKLETTATSALALAADILRRIAHDFQG